ncbi:uncharacterized protein LOC122049662 isoform X1 [Zingiber officinale]|uniref:Uncharacterized protein n=1 Tax=Zingiber officinale TaxID=94328 RepID=A0A8J5HK61_ZINOF|nr:uncharacterized protein LOC122049662 isoform X1 [Zingiber officinale]KAG6526616.1 hypothetical protein ZIOFF_016608 [Zingiber officinale]
MEPCRFVRLIVESLVLKLPAVAKPAGPGVHPSATPCFCTLHLEHGPSAAVRSTVPLPVSADPTSSTSLIEAPAMPAVAEPVVISLDPETVQRLAGRRSGASLIVAVYVGRAGGRACGLASGRLLGRVRVAVDLEAAPARPTVVQSGWVSVGTGRTAARLHLVVRSEPDPRFVFQFGGEPECSPVVYQVQGTGGGGHSGRNLQPVFSCRFSVERRRSTRSLSLRSLASTVSRSDSIRSWFAGGEREHQRRREQRKGWTVTIHDLSGSPVAAASMVTPFVPSPGSDRVSRSNPGAWLILCAVGTSGTADSAATNWKPWGRLEAWRERGPADGGALGYRFQLVPDAAGADVPIAESSIGARKGGQFRIDVTADMAGAAAGFVMGSTVEGERKPSKPTVQVGVQHVSCMADVALFIALSAAVDLSMDACRLFSQKLRKELCKDQQDSGL